MEILERPGWSDAGNHDSKYDVDMVKALIAQAADIAPLAQAHLMPERLGIFVRHCLFGDKPVWIVKGIHQRWKSINAAGQVNKEADPHIQVEFEHRFPGAKAAAWVRIHVCLSEEPQAVRQLHRRKQVIDCSWKTVGITAKRGELREKFPAVFAQSVENIQSQQPGRRGLKRRYSVGLLVLEREAEPVI